MDKSVKVRITNVSIGVSRNQNSNCSEYLWRTKVIKTKKKNTNFTPNNEFGHANVSILTFSMVASTEITSFFLQKCESMPQICLILIQLAYSWALGCIRFSGNSTLITSSSRAEYWIFIFDFIRDAFVCVRWSVFNFNFFSVEVPNWFPVWRWCSKDIVVYFSKCVHRALVVVTSRRMNDVKTLDSRRFIVGEFGFG